MASTPLTGRANAGTMRADVMHPDGYFALVLAEDSAQMLRDTFATLANPIAHHCTIRYGTNRPADLPRPFTAMDLGRVFRLRVKGYARSAGMSVEAVAVALVLPDQTLLENGFTENAVPHVTIATDGTEEPARANDLLQSGYDRIDGPELEATLMHIAPEPK